jgi:fluoroquinolone resistance protein
MLPSLMPPSTSHFYRSHITLKTIFKLMSNMNQVFIEEKTFDKIDFTQTSLERGEYEHCTFISCDLSKLDLPDTIFSECEFIRCNLSLVKLAETALRDVKFKDCKMLGIDFENCNEFGFAVYFEGCTLDRASFTRSKLKKTVFKNSNVQEVDFTQSDLSLCTFDNCDLAEAIFKNTNIEKADFRTAFNYSIDPELNRIKKAKFSRSGIAGLLNKYDIEIDLVN